MSLSVTLDEIDGNSRNLHRILDMMFDTLLDVNRTGMGEADIKRLNNVDVLAEVAVKMATELRSHATAAIKAEALS